MLVLSRKDNEDVVIEVYGLTIVAKVVRIGSDKVRLGFEAPPDVKIHRREVCEAIQREKLTV